MQPAHFADLHHAGGSSLRSREVELMLSSRGACAVVLLPVLLKWGVGVLLPLPMMPLPSPPHGFPTPVRPVPQ